MRCVAALKREETITVNDVKDAQLSKGLKRKLSVTEGSVGGVMFIGKGRGINWYKRVEQTMEYHVQKQRLRN